MIHVAEIQEQILSLEEPNYFELREWFYDLDWKYWDGQIEADSQAGRLHALIADAIESKEAGVLTNL